MPIFLLLSLFTSYSGIAESLQQSPHSSDLNWLLYGPFNRKKIIPEITRIEIKFKINKIWNFTDWRCSIGCFGSSYSWSCPCCTWASWSKLELSGITEYLLISFVKIKEFVPLPVKFAFPEWEIIGCCSIVIVFFYVNFIRSLKGHCIISPLTIKKFLILCHSE